ncbi:YveK family protein [Lapidilactobacillus gannanensis]|uniref:Capsular polysaccharide biosynthesis protein n=1 Tax=Lapidilactobacillus gannanensis TaxID=2486002 RepID=A0ABW4BR47_9LACO|nr:hypothetical protein [Lapidilactobacillus gannanensis]
MNISEQTQTIKNLAKNLVKSWRVFVIFLVSLTLILGLGSYWYGHHQTSTVTYKATSKILITPDKKKNLDGGNLQVYLNTEKTIIGSDKFSSYLGKKLFNKNIAKTRNIDYQVESENGTSIISIHTVDSNSSDARKIANGISREIIKNPKNILQGGSAEIISTNIVTQVASSRSLKKLLILSIAIALIISLIITFIWAFHRGNIYDSTILAQAFKTSVIYNVHDEHALEDAFNKIFRRITQLSSEKVLDLSILYFNDSQNFVPTLLKVLNDKQINPSVYVYTNDEITTKSDYVQQLKINDLYETNFEKPKIDLIDCSDVVNSGLGSYELVIVKDGMLTKKQLAKLQIEIGQVPNKKMFIIYYSGL